MFRKLLALVWIVGGWESAIADDILNELYDAVAIEHQKPLMEHTYQNAREICKRGLETWQHAFNISQRRAYQARTLTKDTGYTLEENTLADLGKEGCQKNVDFWIKRCLITQFMANTSTTYRNLINFIKLHHCEGYTDSPPMLALTVIEKQFDLLTRSYFNYLKTEKSAVTKQQTGYYVGYLYAYGESAWRKAGRLYNSGELFDMSLSFPEQREKWKSFLLLIFSFKKDDMDFTEESLPKLLGDPGRYNIFLGEAFQHIVNKIDKTAIL